MNFTQEELAFLKTLLSQLNVNPANKDAQKTVSIVQGLLVKFTEVKDV